jgi:dephospho-CoA kinase
MCSKSHNRLSMERLIVGVVGPIAAGKGTVVEFLAEKGFYVSSTSDRIAEEIVDRELKLEREVFQDVADDLRKKFGGDILARRTVVYLDLAGAGNSAVDSIRNPKEVEYLQTAHQAYILGVDASRENRFHYLLKREKEGDPETWDEFVRVDRRETETNLNSYSQQVQACLKMANLVIKNNGTKEEFISQLETVFWPDLAKYAQQKGIKLKL